MCGITGFFQYERRQPLRRELLREMTSIIAHRGPDGEGYYIDEERGIGFGHRRLSIIDLSGGHQPMSDSHESVWIVFNGEIYNFPELRKELVSYGHHFRTHSDTEVIIYAYKEWGVKAFEKLNGIFAFALFDKKNDTLILVRDHFGVKPLYYWYGNGKLIFGSEIKCILKDRTIPCELDLNSLYSFLTFRYNPSPQTLIKGIKKLPPGHFLQIARNGVLNVQPFWEYQPVTNTHISETEAVEEYTRLLETAIRRQMISDVPVGLLLSGGIDSAAIGTIMCKELSVPLKSFTIGFEGKGDFNELNDARETAMLIGSEHYEMTITQKEYMDFFWKSFYYTEEPIASTTIPALYYISRLASQHLKVVLAGQGADEPLAGYPRYRGEKFLSQFGSFFRLLPDKFILSLFPRNEQLRRAFYASQFSNELERFLALYTIFTPPQIQNLLKVPISVDVCENNLHLLEGIYKNTFRLQDSLSRILYMDTRLSLSDNLLLFGDKMAMANSLEMRVPFLDVPLIEFLETLPGTFKLHGLVGKYIHKKAIQKWLPAKIINRKKRGFTTPMDQWMRTDFVETVRALFNDKNSICQELFDINYINTLLVEHKEGKNYYERHLFALLSLEIWYQRFFKLRGNGFLV